MGHSQEVSLAWYKGWKTACVALRSLINTLLLLSGGYVPDYFLAGKDTGWDSRKLLFLVNIKTRGKEQPLVLSYLKLTKTHPQAHWKFINECVLSRMLNLYTGFTCASLQASYLPCRCTGGLFWCSSLQEGKNAYSPKHQTYQKPFVHFINLVFMFLEGG